MSRRLSTLELLVAKPAFSAALDTALTMAAGLWTDAVRVLLRCHRVSVAAVNVAVLSTSDPATMVLLLADPRLELERMPRRRHVFQAVYNCSVRIALRWRRRGAWIRAGSGR
jgi:hypothetical protein